MLSNHFFIFLFFFLLPVDKYRYSPCSSKPRFKIHLQIDLPHFFPLSSSKPESQLDFLPNLSYLSVRVGGKHNPARESWLRNSILILATLKTVVTKLKQEMMSLNFHRLVLFMSLCFSPQAAYTVGGHSYTAAAMEYEILKMKPPMHRPQIAPLLAFHKLKVSEE